MPLLAKSTGVPTKVDKSAERPGVSKRQVKSSPIETIVDTPQQITDQVFKPPSRNVHPRLQTLIERYKDGTEGEENQKEGEGSKVTPRVTGEGSKVTTPDRSEGSSVTSSRVTSQIKTRGWPYNKLPTQPNASKGSVEKPLRETGSAKIGNTDIGCSAKHAGDSGSSNGNGVKEGEQKATSLMDSQEQRDISALIQKHVSVPKTLLQVKPPKLTSQVVASLLSLGSPTSPTPTLTPPLSATL
ncbi:uncharacterized protein LOC135473564 [Liolophura sinensis]|uniref:uncharacterized protein LOC135473564 n=1 Tax=Liolophura sinensis TaxID=3198878 RepID=UPI00315812BA